MTAPGQAKKVALLGSLDPRNPRTFVVHTSPTKRSSDFVAHLEQLDRLLWPKTRSSPYHTIGAGRGQRPHPAPANSRWRRWPPRAHWLTVEWLPKYAPELNDIETVWRDLEAHHLAHQTFDDIDALNDAIHQAVDALNAERAAASVGQATNLCLAQVERRLLGGQRKASYLRDGALIWRQDRYFAQTHCSATMSARPLQRSPA